jgi:hypothetical protein
LLWIAEEIALSSIKIHVEEKLPQLREMCQMGIFLETELDGLLFVFTFGQTFLFWHNGCIPDFSSTWDYEEVLVL